MSFYESSFTNQEKQYYVRMLKLMGSLSNLFSNNDKPYLASRVTENLFCRYLNAKNLSRSDITADAKKNTTGIGIKTWIGANKQKIAEFNAEKPSYEHLNDTEMIHRISTLRNDRIDFTMRTNGLSNMVYHCTIREKGLIKIAECPLAPINIANIKNISRSRNIITFEDGINRYSFNTSKSTLYKDFSDLQILDSIKVHIIKDPFLLLEQNLLADKEGIIKFAGEIPSQKPFVFLPLYAYTKSKGKYVQEKAALNIRFAGGRKRDPYEMYIAISRSFNEKHRSFFPPSDQPFNLTLPDGKILSARICQQGDKALMTNPNSALGHWLIDQVFKIPPHNPITYNLLEKYGIDSVRITKESNNSYSIDFARTGSYETFMGLSEDDSINDTGDVGDTE